MNIDDKTWQRMVEYAKTIKLAMPYLDKTECSRCDLEVGWQCPVCGFESSASDLSRVVLGLNKLGNEVELGVCAEG